MFCRQALTQAFVCLHFSYFYARELNSSYTLPKISQFISRIVNYVLCKILCNIIILADVELTFELKWKMNRVGDEVHSIDRFINPFVISNRETCWLD